jgi:streptomycin 6-kinase
MQQPRTFQQKCNNGIISLMDTLNENIISLYGQSGKKWLHHLPEFLFLTAQELDIKLEDAFSELTYNYVAPAIDRDGNHLVLKCGYPNDDIDKEVAALQFFDGSGCVRLISSDHRKGWLLLELCCPGQHLSTETHEDIATHNAVRVMQHLWKPITKKHKFKTVEDWLHGLEHLSNTENNIIPDDMIANAKQISQELLNSMGEQVLLHGDLHHHNIVSAKREPWLAIDPKGVVGEREYEFGAFLRNPTDVIASHKELSSLINRRMDIICELTQFDRKRILSWTFVQAVLSAWWSIEDGTQGADVMKQFAQTTYDLL